MYKETRLKQGSVAWLNLKAKRVGTSEAYALIRHYATDNELLSAGLQPEDVRGETPCVGEMPYASAYAIYQRIVNNVYIPSINIWDDLFGKAVEAWVKSKYTVAPKATVYASNLRVCSLDALGGNGCALGIPDNAVVEIKSRRPQVADKFKLSWRVQNMLQQVAAKNHNGIILQITLADNSENMRGAVAKMYEMLPRKKFFDWFDGIDKQITIYPNPFDERLLALYEICEARFWEDIRTKNPPVPVIDEEPNRKCVNEMLGSYVGEGLYNGALNEYNLLKDKIDENTGKLLALKQRIFATCLRQRVATLRDSTGAVAKFTKAGSLTIK